MGMFASIRVSNQITLPFFPSGIPRDGLTWQSKQGLDVYSGPYRITADGRLERKERSWRDKTDEEKQTEAEEWGCDSWDEYCQLYEQEESLTWPDELDWDKEEDGYENSPPTLFPSETTLDEEWWADHNMHGTFEFHQAIKRVPLEYEEFDGPLGQTKRPSEYALDVFLEYEARFDKGDLTDVVFMGERIVPQSGDDPMGSAMEKIDAWEDWRDEHTDGSCDENYCGETSRALYHVSGETEVVEFCGPHSVSEGDKSDEYEFVSELW